MRTVSRSNPLLHTGDTHILLVLVVMNPDDVAAFFCHLKTELAHVINELLVRNKRTLRCEGDDSPIVVSPSHEM